MEKRTAEITLYDAYQTMRRARAQLLEVIKIGHRDAVASGHAEEAYVKLEQAITIVGSLVDVKG